MNTLVRVQYLAPRQGHHMSHTIPRKWSKWLHEKKNKTYTVIAISNRTATDPRYPITIVYKDSNGEVWSRPFTEWYGSMVLVSEPWYIRIFKFLFRKE